MMHEVVVPSAGESVTEGVLAGWNKEDGESVAEGETICDLETDKVTMQVTAPQAGRLRVLVAAGSTVRVGQVIAHIEGAEAARVEPGPPLVAPAGMPQAREKLASETPVPASSAAADGAAGAPVAGAPAAPAARALSPAVRRLVAEAALDPGTIPSTGPRGHLTKGDVLQHLAAQAAAPASAAPAAPAPSAPSVAPARETRTKLTVIRQRIAERMVLAQHQAAILTTFNEVDMSRVMALRAENRESFEKRHGARLGFMSFFVKAVVEALRTVPALNTRLDGDELVQNHYFDIGVAVSTERGLIVPVIRDCDRLGFGEIEAAIADLASRARARTIKLEELTGGCFTISNGGVYGSLLSTPILNPPQSGILGLHAVKRRPVVVGDAIVIRPMMYLAMSYDHRLVDGEQAVTFLKRIVECIESPERIMLAS